MKVRSGFVSNSSSSSFVVIGKKVSLDEVCSDKKFDKPIYMIGDTMCDGVEYFEITEEHRKLIRENKKFFKPWYDLVLEYATADEEGVFCREDLPEKFNIIPFEKDYHTDSNDLDSFEEKYFEYKSKRRQDW